MLKLAALAFAMAGLALPVAAQEPQIIDGDTFLYFGEPIRIYGIDAPEAGQLCALPQGETWDCGAAAMNTLRNLVLDGVTCSTEGIDAYDRRLAICNSARGDVGAEMIRVGMAWSFRRYASRYDTLEDEVRQTGIGIWQAETETPWDLRARHWQSAEQAAPDGCPIKGSISPEGERLYHTPWSPWYARIDIDDAKGERWFCDEAQALDAGWHAPLWGR